MSKQVKPVYIQSNITCSTNLCNVLHMKIMDNVSLSCFISVSTLITSTTVGSANTIIEAATNGLYLDTLVYSSNTVSGPNVPTTGDVIGMDVDVNRDYLYFGDRSNTGLFRVKLSDISDSSDGRTLIVDGVKIWGVAYDWINDYLYWTEDG